ncbi:MAG: ABC transporter permease [Bacteriovoracaceae bacterium]
MNDLIFLLSTTLMYSTPLIFTALGGVMSEKTGIVNIGLEGMMTIGAFFASLVAIRSGNPWLGLLCGGVAGLVLSSLHALASIKYKANQVVSGMAINFLGGGLSIFLCRLFFEGTSMTPPLDLEKKIPTLFDQYYTVYIAFFMTFIIWFIFNKTVLGLRLISVGEHPKSADAAGFSVGFYRSIGVLSSGFLAGLGGASLSIAIVSNFRPTLISGQGFIALAALIFGKWKPEGTLVACLFFGFSQALVVYIGGKETLQISSQLLSMFPYILTLIVLVGFMGKTTSPTALGVQE